MVVYNVYLGRETACLFTVRMVWFIVFKVRDGVRYLWRGKCGLFGARRCMFCMQGERRHDSISMRQEWLFLRGGEWFTLDEEGVTWFIQGENQFLEFIQSEEGRRNKVQSR